MYIIYFLILISILVIKNKSNIEYNNDYISGKKIHKLITLKKFIKSLYITTIFIDIFYFIISLLYGKDINLIEVIASLIMILLIALSYISLENKCSKIVKSNNYNELNYNEKKHTLLILYNSIISIILINRVGDINNINLSTIANVIPLVLTIVDIILIIIFLYKNKNITSFSSDDENDFIKPINFYKKIEIRKFYNYIIYIIIYILLVYCKLPYAYLFYIFISFILILITIKKFKKIQYEQEKLYKNVTLVNRKPGAIYAFEFEKDIEFTKNLSIFTLLYILSIIIFYTLNNTAFLFFSIQAYIFAIYKTLVSKKNLIKLVYSLDENYIDKNIYNIKHIEPLITIDTINIKILNIKLNLYKLIYIDNNKNIYESNIILYDPELYVDNIIIYINSKDINDYIIITEELY